MARKPRLLVVKYSYPEGFQERLKKDARQAGVEVDFCRWQEIVIDTASTTPEQVISVNKKRIDSYDLIYIRSIMDRYYEFTQLVNVASSLGIIVVDKNIAWGNRVNDLKVQQITQAAMNGIPVPRTLFATDTSLVAMADRLGSWPLVLKVMGLHKGQGVFLVQDKKEVRRLMDKFIATHESKNFLLQELINYEADYRIFVVGNKVLGAIERIPQGTDFRANVSRGGQAKAIKKLPAKLENLAIRVTKKLGFDIAGVDFMEDGHGNYYFLEANRAPGYAGLEEATGINVQVEILKYLKDLIQNKHAES